MGGGAWVSGARERVGSGPDHNHATLVLTLKTVIVLLESLVSRREQAATSAEGNVLCVPLVPSIYPSVWTHNWCL